MNRRIFLGLLPAAGALFGLKAKAVTAARKPSANRFIAPAEFYAQNRAVLERSLASEHTADLAFYSGDQWPADVRAKRKAAGRPCLTVNYLPGIVAQLSAGQTLNGQEHEALKIDVVRKFRDHQMVLNYAKSNMAEMLDAEFARIGCRLRGVS